MNSGLDADLIPFVLDYTDAERIDSVETIQDLWSGYGKIMRLRFGQSNPASLIAKHIRPPKQSDHPRGWNSPFAHERKRKSYEVEMEWYLNWSRECDPLCRLPRFLSLRRLEDSVLLLLEDLDEAGYPIRHSKLSTDAISPCLRWLARFHGYYMGRAPNDLWETGTYWHLETRPEEWKEISDPALKNAAKSIDLELYNARYQTIVHGDAKLANFCFSPNGEKVAMVDFQYVGGGCGMKDVAYFLGSSLSEEECEAEETRLLEIYFNELRNSIRLHHPNFDPEAIVREWTDLYPTAWTDFHRFLMGWCPDHWKVNAYSQRLARQVLDRLQTCP